MRKNSPVQNWTMMRKRHTGSESTVTATPERRYIYTGDNRPSAPGYVVRPNRRATRRRISTFNIILLLLAFGVSIVLYVNNIITVNRLVVEIDQMQQKYNAIQNINAALQAEVTQKAALERVGGIAREQLKMQYPAEQPGWIDIDTDNLPELKGR
jgi:cell division protein FtsL